MDERFIDEFRDMMELKYAEHYPEKGDSWRTCDINFLWSKLFEEAIETTEAGIGPLRSAMSELVDLALVAAMLWQRERDILVEKKAAELPPNFLDGLSGRR